MRLITPGRLLAAMSSCARFGSKRSRANTASVRTKALFTTHAPSYPLTLLMSTTTPSIVTKFFDIFKTLHHSGKTNVVAPVSHTVNGRGDCESIAMAWRADVPHEQGWYEFNQDAQKWDEKKDQEEQHSPGGETIDSIALLSWNIDFMLPFAKARMKPALDHLENLVKRTPSNSASVIFMQECTLSDVVLIKEIPWIQKRFRVTDLNSRNWGTWRYGTISLIDKRLPIKAAFRVHYSKTQMNRDAFFVDTAVNDKTIRLCNTHLESLAFHPPCRPAQMELIAKYLHDPKVHAGLVAGDFNANQPFDRTLHANNNLKDAFLELGGKEGTEEGYTWGQQARKKARERFGCSRMDKIFYCGGIDVNEFERFGRDVVVQEKKEAEEIVAMGFEKAWVTDHLGVKAVVKLTKKGSSRL
ncbi:hypothetical protein NLU13_2578 [Sarocladium strictum]|uniref:Endonuclease/exonuclease/phosphatase domain-containing protein n=1 Tax=Sarocladium strictum TaxID=5046 RepID=A0AA39GKS4_SARSR|nr:hypothetical protein NLU13_2578 [Sarocladium strictum]